MKIRKIRESDYQIEAEQYWKWLSLCDHHKVFQDPDEDGDKD